MPKTIDAAYLSSKLRLKPGSAGVVMANFRTLGLVDEFGKTTQLANLWRDEEGYKEACERILQLVFPDVVEAFPPPDPDRAQLERWFATKTGAGEGAAGQMAMFYQLVAASDPDGKPQKSDKVEGNSRRSPSATRRAKPAATGGRQPNTVRTDAPADGPAEPSLPKLHIDLQIHLSADAPDSQIESLFRNMAKYIYGKSVNG